MRYTSAVIGVIFIGLILLYLRTTSFGSRHRYIGSCRDTDQVCHIGMGDESLGAVDDIIIAIFNSSGLEAGDI